MAPALPFADLPHPLAGARGRGSQRPFLALGPCTVALRKLLEDYERLSTAVIGTLELPPRPCHPQLSSAWLAATSSSQAAARAHAWQHAFAAIDDGPLDPEDRLRQAFEQAALAVSCADLLSSTHFNALVEWVVLGVDEPFAWSRQAYC